MKRLLAVLLISILSSNSATAQQKPKSMALQNPKSIYSLQKVKSVERLTMSLPKTPISCPDPGTGGCTVRISVSNDSARAPEVSCTVDPGFNLINVRGRQDFPLIFIISKAPSDTHEYAFDKVNGIKMRNHFSRITDVDPRGTMDPAGQLFLVTVRNKRVMSHDFDINIIHKEGGKTYDCGLADPTIANRG